MSGYISTNSGIHHQFRIYYKGGKASQLWVSSCKPVNKVNQKWVISEFQKFSLLLLLLSSVKLFFYLYGNEILFSYQKLCTKPRSEADS